MNTAEQKSFLPVVWKLVLCIGGTAPLPRSLSCATDTVCRAHAPQDSPACLPGFHSHPHGDTEGGGSLAGLAFLSCSTGG